jgi:hypothetical protein
MYKSLIRLALLLCLRVLRRYPPLQSTIRISFSTMVALTSDRFVCFAVNFPSTENLTINVSREVSRGNPRAFGGGYALCHIHLDSGLSSIGRPFSNRTAAESLPELTRQAMQSDAVRESCGTPARPKPRSDTLWIGRCNASICSARLAQTNGSAGRSIGNGPVDHPSQGEKGSSPRSHEIHRNALECTNPQIFEEKEKRKCCSQGNSRWDSSV